MEVCVVYLRNTHTIHTRFGNQ